MEIKKIYGKIREAELYSEIFDILPPAVSASLSKADLSIAKSLSEIRLRANGISSVCSCGYSYIITADGIGKGNPLRLTEKDIDSYIYRLCGGSVYSYESSIASGFITVNGIRNGIAGDITVKDGKIIGFSSVKSVNIRLPKHIAGCADGLLCHLYGSGIENTCGILVASSPGVGKTTVLRELAIRLTDSKKHISGHDRLYRVSVIDERNELYIPSLFTDCCADIFTGVKKHIGIELASRTMSPEIIIFDEIGSDRDADAVISAHFGGITFISSVHADSVSSAMTNRAVKLLCKEGVFDCIYLLKRTDTGVEGSLHKIGAEMLC